MKNMRSFFKSIFTDEKGGISSKRFCGVVCVLALVICLLLNSLCHRSSEPSPPLIDAVTMLAFGLLGLTSFEKYSHNKHVKKEEE
jgi:hypothetical protein